MKSIKLAILITFSLLMTQYSIAGGTEKYPARVVSGPNFAMEAFEADPQRFVKLVPHLVRLEFDWGLDNWYFTKSDGGIELNVDLHPKLTSFLMHMPDGGTRRINMREAGINTVGLGYGWTNIELEAEFGKIGLKSKITLWGNRGKFARNSTFRNFLPTESKLIDYTNKHNLHSIREIMDDLDPQISFINKGYFSNGALPLRQIRMYIDKVYNDYAAREKKRNSISSNNNSNNSNYTNSNNHNTANNSYSNNSRRRSNYTYQDNSNNYNYSARQKVEEYNNNLVRQGNSIYRQSQQTERTYQQIQNEIHNAFSDGKTAAQRRQEIQEELEEDGRRRAEEQRLRREQEIERERQARQERERREAEIREKKRIEAEKVAMADSRKNIFAKYPGSKLPVMATKTSSNNLFYFSYAYNNSDLKTDYPVVYVSNVFAIGQYPDGTWPMTSKIKTEISKLTPYDEIIYGSFNSETGASNALYDFVNSVSETGMKVQRVSYKGKNAHQVTVNNQNSATVDFWGNPVKKNNSTQKTISNSADKNSANLDFWGNPIKK